MSGRPSLQGLGEARSVPAAAMFGGARLAGGGALQSAPAPALVGRVSLHTDGELQSAPSAGLEGRPSSRLAVDLALGPTSAGHGGPAVFGLIDLGLPPELLNWSTSGSATFSLRTAPAFVAAGSPASADSLVVSAVAATGIAGRPGGVATVDIQLVPSAEAVGSGAPDVSPATFSDGTIWTDGTIWIDGDQ